MSNSSDQAVDLMSVNDDTFNEHVNADIRGTASDAVSEALRQPQVVERWHNCLLANKNSVEAQLVHGKAERTQKFADCVAQGSSGKQEWLDFLATQNRWRSGAIRVMKSAEVKLVEAKQLLRREAAAANIPSVIRERNEALKQVQRLQQGILAHQEAVVANEDDTQEADENLWNLVVKE